MVHLDPDSTPKQLVSSGLIETKNRVSDPHTSFSDPDPAIFGNADPNPVRVQIRIIKETEMIIKN